MGIEGRAVIQCGVSADGGLLDCGVVSENPGGYGFGNGALQMTPMFRMASQTLGGMSVAGGRIRLAITFRRPPGQAGQRQGLPFPFAR